jgi:hypothetical protein
MIIATFSGMPLRIIFLTQFFADRGTEAPHILSRRRTTGTSHPS